MSRSKLGGVVLAGWMLAVGVARADAQPAGEAQEAAEPEGEGSKIKWIKGPTEVDLGDDLAKLDVAEGYAFAGADDARAILEDMGNRTDGSELGLVIPTAEGDDWFIVLEWQPVGFVKDSDKDKIDADALLESIREGTEEGNEWRKEHGIPALHVTGWAEPPRYDLETHHLVWATLAKNEEGRTSANYNMRLLGRRGYVSATLVEQPEKLDAAKPAAIALVKGFSFKTGGTYGEWRAGDKVAEYGLVGLVAAGAGAAAVKLGLFAYLAKLLAKMGKFVVVLAAGAAAGLSRLWRALRSRVTGEPVDPNPPPAA